MRPKTLAVVVALGVFVSVAADPVFGQRGHDRGHGGPPVGAVLKPSHGPRAAHVQQSSRPAKPPKPVGLTGKHRGPAHGNPPRRAEAHARKAETHARAQHELARIPVLITKLRPMLPPGTNLESAALGFRNLGQFVAAVNVSHNLGIPFDHLKARMVGPNPMSLGQAIQDLRPASDWRREMRRAEEAAEVLIRISRTERTEVRIKRDKR